MQKKVPQSIDHRDPSHSREVDETVDILPDIAEALAVGVCTFNYTPDPDEPQRPHGHPCEQLCDYCRAHAEYLLQIMEQFRIEGES